MKIFRIFFFFDFRSIILKCKQINQQLNLEYSRKQLKNKDQDFLRKETRSGRFLLVNNLKIISFINWFEIISNQILKSKFVVYADFEK